MYLAQIYYMLSNKLSTGVKTKLLNTLESRIFSPMRLSFNNDTWIKSKHFWETANNNWNAVCWTGVTFAYIYILRTFYAYILGEHFSGSIFGWFRNFLLRGYFWENRTFGADRCFRQKFFLPKYYFPYKTKIKKKLELFWTTQSISRGLLRWYMKTILKKSIIVKKKRVHAKFSGKM